VLLEGNTLEEVDLQPNDTIIAVIPSLQNDEDINDDKEQKVPAANDDGGLCAYLCGGPVLMFDVCCCLVPLLVCCCLRVGSLSCFTQRKGGDEMSLKDRSK